MSETNSRRLFVELWYENAWQLALIVFAPHCPTCHHSMRSEEKNRVFITLYHFIKDTITCKDVALAYFVKWNPSFRKPHQFIAETVKSNQVMERLVRLQSLEDKRYVCPHTISETIRDAGKCFAQVKNHFDFDSYAILS